MSKHYLFIILVAVCLTTSTANAWELKEHPIPIPCIGCHYETLQAPYAGYGEGEGRCDGCHEYKLNVTKLESGHNPKICKACHMGSTIAGGSEKAIFHNGHNAVKCTQCHTEDNFTVIKIKNNGFECVSCHGNKVHNIHIKNLDKICSICHGSWAKDKIYIASATTKSNTSLRQSNLEGLTITNIIRSLFNIILGGT